MAPDPDQSRAEYERVSSEITLSSERLAKLAADVAIVRKDHASMVAALIQSAKTALQGSTSNLNNNLDIIQSRQSFTEQFVNILADGANKLTQADQNEESANMLQLQTRQQLGTITLSLANQAQQAILKLF